jgi:hypothetical protein
VQGASLVAIAAMLGVSRETVMYDIRLEGTRRAEERAADRKLLIENSVSGYEGVALAAAVSIQKMAAELAEAPTWKERAALRSAIPKERQVILKAMRQAEEVQGLHDSSLAINIDNSTTNQTVVVETQELLSTLTGDMRAELRERRRLEAMRNVTPLT